jgi:hypothetical protein
VLVALLSVEVGYLVGDRGWISGSREDHPSERSARPAVGSRNNKIPASGPIHERLECISEGALKSVRAQPSAIVRYRGLCHDELKVRLATLQLDEGQQDAVMASIFAHSLAPYGPSKAIELKDLLRATQLDCDNYAMLTGHLLKHLPVSGYNLRVVGFDGGVTGNHAQLIFETANGQILLDPTIGLAARAEFNQVMSGTAIDPNQVHVFYRHNDPVLKSFADRVADALVNGRYRPSDLLYYFLDVADYSIFQRETERLWKSDRKRLIRRFPTPGAAALKSRLLTP